jgi:hypothetical protein
MTVDTNIIYTKDDLGKNLYRKKTYYTLVVEQEVLAKDKDEAEQKFLDDGGIDHSQINHEITTNKNGVETYMVDANYSDSGNTEYMGKVTIEEDEDEPAYAEVTIDGYANENALTEKEESDVDIAIQLEAENQRGK